MGAQQSSPLDGQDQNSNSGNQKTCYYELLGIDRQATDQDIKKAYRRKALELHPDRNFNDVQTATKKFAEVQTAYEILSDPQERGWYDSHRDAVLSGHGGINGEAEATTFRNVRLTTTEEILGLMRRFNATIPFNDEPNGFFAVARETFDHLALEEAVAELDGFDSPEYPSFGSSDDGYDKTVKLFYNAWSGFSTKKSFSWKDKYRLSDAADRRGRRLMEKENKRLRDEAIREFNEAVRFLVSFVRKRDPRYLPNSQTDADRQRSLRLASAAQAARSRAENQEKLSTYEVPEWVRNGDEDPTPDRFSEVEESESEIEILECIVCKKSFKSEQQLEAHERSKKHIKALQQFRRQMQREGLDLDLDTDNTTHLKPQSHDESPATKSIQSPCESIQPIVDSTALHKDEIGGSRHCTSTSPATSNHAGTGAGAAGNVTVRHAPDTQDIAPTEAAVASQHNDIKESSEAVVEEGNVAPESTTQVKKLGKAKAKKQKKAAALQESEKKHRCAVCGSEFSSRTKMFNHIDEEGHAAPIPAAFEGTQKKAKRLR